MAVLIFSTASLPPPISTLIPIFFYIAKPPQFDAVTAETPKLKDW
ncbi:MAG: hypothetical protein ACFB0D_01795 [Phormidesmis sp.]